MPKEKAPCKCLSIIMLDFVIKANKTYYPETLLEECKYVRNILMKIQKKVNQIVTLIRQNLRLTMMKMINNLLKVLNSNKSLIVCVNHT